MHQQQWNSNSDVLRLNESLKKLDRQHTAQMSVLQEVLTKIGKRYFYVERNHHQNWFSASKSCVEMGGQLAVIQDEQELRDLRRRITHDTSYWLDINDLVNEEQYVSWTTGKRAPFLTWQSGEPNNAHDREHCVDLYKGVFYDDKCETRYYFICQASED
ncbi:C-type lectin 37Db-like isoform X2 [Drosophila suzukii]|uniref:C-type lectin 37Db-like isoform X2 n=1 Tax=Drosophila suzukii TaxID=28584 RepID=A0ABM4TLF9_DROSZ